MTTPLLHGVKNEIVLASYGGNNTYSFVVELNGLEPAESTGDSIPLLDENGALKAYINIEELRDAEGKVSLQNRIDIAPYEEDGKYLVMVTLDEAFMTDPQTVYPLTATSPASIYGDNINDTDVNLGSPVDQLRQLVHAVGGVYQWRDLPVLPAVYHRGIQRRYRAGQYFKCVHDSV